MLYINNFHSVVLALSKNVNNVESENIKVTALINWNAYHTTIIQMANMF